MSRILLKVGGAQLEDPAARATLCRSVATASREGHRVIVVHGGGNQIRNLTAKLGIPDRYHEGLRITDAATADVALMVLGGLVNRTLVASLQQAGVPAVGLTGADGGTFGAVAVHGRDEAGGAVELGYVGEVQRVNPALVETLLETGYCPVLGSVAPPELMPPQTDETTNGEAGSGNHFYNINADTLAGSLATHFCCDTLLLLTDVPGVKDGSGALLPRISAADVTTLTREGIIHGGMVPKVRAALQAAAAAGRGVTVKIASAQGEDAVRHALREQSGTVVCP